MHEVTLALCAEMLVSGRLARSVGVARKLLQAAVDSGAAAEKFGRWSPLGGPKKFVDDPWKHLEWAPLEVPVFPVRPGVVRSVDTWAVGMVVVALGWSAVPGRRTRWTRRWA